MKKIIKLKIRNAEGVLVSNDLVSCSIEEAYKKEKVTVFNKQGTMQGALAAVNNYLNEWFEGYRATTM